MKRQILSPLHRAHRQVAEHLEPRMAALGLSNAEGHLLSFLRSYEPTSVGHLHRVFGHKRSTLTSMLDRLETGGKLRRTPNPEDRRSFLVRLTAGGRRLADRTNRHVEQLETALLSACSKEDLVGFRAVVAAIDDVTQIDLSAKESLCPPAS